jgi:hypothetical protein
MSPDSTRSTVFADPEHKNASRSLKVHQKIAGTRSFAMLGIECRSVSWLHNVLEAVSPSSLNESRLQKKCANRLVFRCVPEF